MPKFSNLFYKTNVKIIRYLRTLGVKNIEFSLIFTLCTQIVQL